MGTESNIASGTKKSYFAGDFGIIVDNDNLKSYGFAKISVVKKNIVVNFSNGNAPILSRFKIDDLESTLGRLQKKLIGKGINKNAVQQFNVFLTEKLLQNIKELPSLNSGSASSACSQKILEEIQKEKNSIGQISIEQWQAGVLAKYQKLQNIVNAKLANLWPAIEFVLSVKSILNIKDCTLPFAGILLGAPSSLKTVGIELFRKWPQTYYTDNFSAKSFVSHSTAVTKEELEEIDMLPKIRDKLFLTPELAPTFAAKDDDLIEVLGIMTRILDGHGYESNTGARGHRGYNERMMFAWVGAAVDIPYKVHRYLGTLGPKLYFLRLPKVEKTEEEYIAQINSNFEEMVKEIEKALFEYLKWFEMWPEKNNTATLPKINWNTSKDDVDTKRYIVRLARLLSYFRGVVPTWHTHDTQGSNYGYGMAIKEECDRAITQLYNLARGNALSGGRNYVTLEDVPLIIKVVLSTASIERVTIFDLLLARKGTMNSLEIATSLNISQPTALRTMTELKALGLVQMVNGDPNTPAKITLDPQFNWVFDKQFLELRNGFVPSDNSQYLKEERKEKSPPITTSNNYNSSLPTNNTSDLNNNSSSNIDLETKEEEKSEVVRGKFSLCSYQEKETIFWRLFEELSNEDNGLVDYDKLQERLISTGKFYSGDSVLMIEHMVKTGKIEQTEQYHVYRITKQASPGQENEI